MQVLPVLLDHGLCNLTNLSSVNKHFRQVISGPQNYFKEHKLRYFARAKRPDGKRKRWIRLVIRGQVLVQGKTVPKPNSIWTVEIYKGLRKGLITIEYTEAIALVTVDLTACRLTSSARVDHRFVHPDPWIVVPLVFTRQEKLLWLMGDPRGALSWINQTTNGMLGPWPRQTKPPRFLRVAFGYLGFYSWFSSSPYYGWPFNKNQPHAYLADGLSFLAELK